MNPVASLYGDEFRHLLEFAPPGTPDSQIPGMCRTEGFDCLVTANIKDFGARKVYYQALVANGIHVVVIRPRVTFYPEIQISMLTSSYRSLRTVLGVAKEPVLVRCTPTNVKVRTIQELIDEFESGRL